MTTYTPTVTIRNYGTPQARCVIDWQGPPPGPNDNVLMDNVLMSVHLFEQCLAILNGEPHTLTPPHLTCCDLHNQHCEPSELCCHQCTEANHPNHPPGTSCVLA